MVTEQQTRKVVKQMKAAGWTPGAKRGSHTKWVCPAGEHTFSLADGHRRVSPGVYRKLLAALKGCEHK